MEPELIFIVLPGVTSVTQSFFKLVKKITWSSPKRDRCPTLRCCQVISRIINSVLHCPQRLASENVFCKLVSPAYPLWSIVTYNVSACGASDAS